ncbi:alpha-ketoglutarate-dependent taurine dioxygenase-like [Mercenaria mercenaria]|uniref:alpha-ketoglutarate-dependent taurine dioxygenase-like n=1 Tax=Mercenaria mercenaria TaxID=6596 RepID=UPI001E1E0492|nr:alpha-ketoglutarate-dependent taurine dioxygenase-like [Mercenaria mercenaria]
MRYIFTNTITRYLKNFCYDNLLKRKFSLFTRSADMQVSEAPLGVIIKGVDLKHDISDDLISQFKKDVNNHRLLIFKNQGTISGKRHVEISQWFGEFESTFYKHPKSPHPDIFRVSNVREEGCTNVGRTGWHIDGSFMEKPFAFSIYHMVSVPKLGNTDFVPLKELIESLSVDTRARWERLWMLPDRRDRLIHPLIYPHPVTKLSTLCFHLGMTEAFVWDYGTDKERVTSQQETRQILQEIHNEIVKDNRRLIYSHKWEEGDFIISDNLAVGHEATPETQYPVEEVGLRILHRTTIRGTTIPQKAKTN